jgi:protein SCO1/2
MRTGSVVAKMDDAWLPTVAALVAIGVAAWTLAAHLTLDFRAWTSDDARRLRVALRAPQLPPLAAIDAAGDDVMLWSENDGERTVYLLTFMYTRCPALCRAAGDEFARLQRDLRATPSPHVRLLSISFDPAFDTASALRDYERGHDVDPAWWKVLAPRSEKALQPLLREAGVVVIDDGLGGFAHNAAIHVVSPDGRLRRIYDLAEYREALRFARVLDTGR